MVKKFPSLKSEFGTLIEEVIQNPSLGIPLGNQCYKIRMAIKSKGKGKSGGARMITYVYHHSETVYLLTIYDKSEKEDLLPKELNEMIADLNLG